METDLKYLSYLACGNNKPPLIFQAGVVQRAKNELDPDVVTGRESKARWKGKEHRPIYTAVVHMYVSVCAIE